MRRANLRRAHSRHPALRVFQYHSNHFAVADAVDECISARLRQRHAKRRRVAERVRRHLGQRVVQQLAKYYRVYEPFSIYHVDDV